MSIFQLAYISAARVPFSEQDLRALLAKARIKNKRLDISGMLVHSNASFLQFLEGPEPDVTRLFETISADERHCKILRMFASNETSRGFEGWSMGYVEADERFARLPGFNDFLRTGFTHTNHTPNTMTKLRDLALQFRLGRWRQHVDA
jgi:hypothetical protein